MKINNKIILLPNKIIDLIPKYGERGLLIYLYLERHRTYRDKAHISLSNCIEECGYKLSDGKGGTNERFKETLQKMIKDGIVKSNIEKFKLNDLIICELEKVNSNFFELEDYQYQYIMNYESKSKKINLLKIFCLIKSKIYTRKKGESIHDGLYEVAFPSYLEIKNMTGISESNIKKYLDELVDLKLIQYSNSGNMKKNKAIKESRNTYVIYKPGWEEELNGSIRLYKEKKKKEGWSFIKDNKN